MKFNEKKSVNDTDEIAAANQKIELLEAQIVQQKIVNSEVTARTDFLESIIAALPNPTIIINSENYIVEHSNIKDIESIKTDQRFCYEISHLQNRSCDGVDHLCPIATIKENGKSTVVEHFHHDKQGHKQIVEILASPIFNKEGKLTHVVEETISIRNLDEIEHKLGELASFFRYNPSPVFQLNTDGRITLANTAASQLLGETEIAGIGVDKLFPKISQNIFTDLIKTGGLKSFEYSVNDKHYQFTVIGVTDMDVAHIYGSDITERKNSEISLKEWALFVESNPAPVLRYDSKGIIILSNPAAEKITRIDSLIGLALIDVFDSMPPGSFIKHIEPGTTSSFEQEFNGRFYNFVIQGVPEYSIGHIYGSDVTESKIAEQQIREQESRFRNLFEESPISIWEEDFTELSAELLKLKQSGVTDFRGFFDNNPKEVLRYLNLIKVMNVNRATLKMFKAADKEELMTKLRRIFTQNSIDVLKDELILLAEGGTSFEGEAEMLDLKGEKVHSLIKLSLIKESNKQTTALVSMIDVTQKKRLEIELTENEMKFRGISSSAQDAIIMIDDKELVTFWNESATRIFGYEADEIIGENIHDMLTDGRDKELTREGCEQFKLSGESAGIGRTMELVGKRKSGEEFPVELSLSAVKLKEKWNAIGILRDISERKANERELQKLKSAVVHNPASIVITDIDGTIEYVNPKFKDITGYSSEEAVGNNPRILKSGKQSRELYVDLWKTISSGKVRSGELVNRAKDGSHYWEAVSISPIMNELGEITNYVGVKEDISDRKKAEQEIQRLIDELQIERDAVEKYAFNLKNTNAELSASEKSLKEINSSKDKFFSIIAHDLRGPFTGFLGLSDLMATESENLDAKDVARMAGAMNNSAKQLFSLLENLLDWSRAHTGIMEFNPESLNMYEQVLRIKKLFTETAANKKIELQSKIDVETIVFADEQMLSTCLRNLVSNALKFTEEGGKITIASGSCENDCVSLSVIDTGVGMDQEAMGKIFRIDAKHSTKGTANEKGTGLGLLLCKELVERNGGKISVKSEVGKGSVFTFTLPKKG